MALRSFSSRNYAAQQQQQQQMALHGQGLPAVDLRIIHFSFIHIIVCFVAIRISFYARARRPLELSTIKQLAIRLIPLISLGAALCHLLCNIAWFRGAESISILGLAPNKPNPEIFWSTYKTMSVSTICHIFLSMVEGLPIPENAAALIMHHGVCIFQCMLTNTQVIEPYIYTANTCFAQIIDHITHLLHLRRYTLIFSSIERLPFLAYFFHTLVNGNFRNFPLSVRLQVFPQLISIWIAAISIGLSLAARVVLGGKDRLYLDALDHPLLRISLEDDIADVLMRLTEFSLTNIKLSLIQNENLDLNANPCSYVEAPAQSIPPRNGFDTVEKNPETPPVWVFKSNYRFSIHALFLMMDLLKLAFRDFLRLFRCALGVCRESNNCDNRKQINDRRNAVQSSSENESTSVESSDEMLYRDFLQGKVPTADDPNDGDYEPSNDTTESDSEIEPSSCSLESDSDDTDAILRELFPDVKAVWNFFVEEGFLTKVLGDQGVTTRQRLRNSDSLSQLQSREIRNKLTMFEALAKAHKDRNLELDASEDMKQARATMCAVCHCAPRDIVFWPCRCLAVCNDCRYILSLRNFEGCPCCRQEVRSYSRIWIP